MVVTLPLNWGPLSKSSSMYTLKPSFSKTIFLKSPLLRSSFKPQFFPYTTQISSPCSSTPLSFSITCKLKTSEDGKSSKSLAKKIVLSEGAPAVSEDGAGNGEAQPKPASKGGGGGGGFGGLVKRFPRKVLSLLSNLPLAIGEMFTVAALMALGMLLTPLSLSLSLSLSLYIYIYKHKFCDCEFWRWYYIGEIGRSGKMFLIYKSKVDEEKCSKLESFLELFPFFLPSFWEPKEEEHRKN